jgi:hypothetical protein
MARPTLLNRDDLIALFHENIRNGASLSTAANAAALGTSTVYAWLARAEELQYRDPQTLQSTDRKFLEFRDATHHARATVELRALKIISDQIDQNNWKAAAWFLERSFPERWSNRKLESEDHLKMRIAGLFPEDHIEPCTTYMDPKRLSN